MQLLKRLASFFTRASHTARGGALTPDTRFIVDSSTRVTGEHEDGRTVMHLGAGRVWAINGLGSDIWQRIADGRTRPEIVADLAARYPVPAEQIDRDVAAFVDRLLALHLIRPVRH